MSLSENKGGWRWKGIGIRGGTEEVRIVKRQDRKVRTEGSERGGKGIEGETGQKKKKKSEGNGNRG